jgi:hypothetical protein
MSGNAAEALDPQLQYPIGKFTYEGPASQEQRNAWITQLAALPAAMEAAVAGFNDEQLDTPYRPGGWTVRQVVHHTADSHMNAYIRLHWALTEDAPLIKAYDEKAWAELPDARTAPPSVSLEILKALHRRWVLLLEALEERHWQREFRHPQYGGFSVERMLALYAWHGRHHTAHITTLRQKMGW